MRGVDYEFDEVLVDDGCVEYDGDEFVDLGFDFGVEIVEFEVVVVVVVFVDYVFGDGVKGSEFEGVV